MCIRDRSKKIASGAERILLDVKTGSGAFMKTTEDAITLAEEMVEIAKLSGRRAAALITDMDLSLIHIFPKGGNAAFLCWAERESTNERQRLKIQKRRDYADESV